MVAPFKPKKTPADKTLVIKRVFNAPCKLVFKAWTQPEYLTRWWGPTDFTLPHCKLDFRPGGSYRFCMRSPEGTDHWVWGVYQEIVEPKRIVFTWFRDDAEGNITNESVVTVTFEAQGRQTKFTLHQTPFKTVEDRDGHQGGWGQCLDRLCAFVSNKRSPKKVKKRKSVKRKS